MDIINSSHSLWNGTVSDLSSLSFYLHSSAFRCAYCYFLNPARKTRPQAPRLPEFSYERRLRAESRSPGPTPRSGTETEESAPPSGGTEKHRYTHTHTSKYPRLGLLGSEFRLDTSSLMETYTHTQSHSLTALCIFMLLTSCSNRPCSVFFFSTMLLLTLFMCLMFDSFPNFNDVSLYPVVVVSEQWASRGETSPPEISPSLQQEETECLGQYYFKTEKLVDVLPDEISWKTGSWQPPSLLSRWCYTTHLVNKSSAGKKCKLMSLLNLFWTDAVKMLVGCHHFLCQPCEHTTVLR